MRWLKFLMVAVPILGFTSLCTSLCRANQIQIELDDIVGQAQTSPPLFGVSDTGSVALSIDPTNNPFISSLGEVRFNGVSQSFSPTATFTLSGGLNLTSGTVTGGSLTVDMNTGADFSFNFSGGSVSDLTGGDYQLTGPIQNLLFTSTTFAGLNITPYESAQPLIGTYEFIFEPGTSGAGTGKDPDIQAFTITANVPEPSSVMALGGLGMLLLSRRRAR